MAKTAVTLLLLAVAVGSAAAASEPAAQPANAAAVLASNTQTSDLWGFVQQYPDIESKLKALGSEAGTFFAPTNSALAAAIEAGKAAGKPITNERLRDILLYHLVPGPPAAVNQLNDAQVFVTALGGSPAKTITAKYTEGSLTLEGEGSSAKIVTPDTFVGPANYGVVHVIDNVLLPDRLPSTVQLATGAGPSTGTGSNQPTSPGIVSAASIEAETAANAAANASPAAAPAAAAAQYETVLEAAKDLNLTSLLGAVNAAGLTGLFGPDFAGTLFAPSNEAFAAALAAAAAVDVDLSAKLLKDILSLHVVNQTLAAADLEDSEELETLGGKSLKVVKKDGAVFLQDPSGAQAEVVEADVTIASGAIVHAIDAVLLPAALASDAPLPVAATPLISNGAGSLAASAAALAASLLGAAMLLA